MILYNHPLGDSEVIQGGPRSRRCVMYLPSCTYIVSGDPGQQGVREPAGQGVRDPGGQQGLWDPGQGLRDYGTSTWLDNSATKPPDYRHYRYETRQQWSMYHQTSHHHHHHHHHLAPAPCYLSPEDSALPSPCTEGGFNHHSERFLGGYDPAGTVFGGPPGTARYHTAAFSSGVGSRALIPPPAGLCGSSKPPPGLLPSAGRSRVLPPGFDSFIEAAEEERRGKNRCSAVGSLQTESCRRAGRRESGLGTVCEEKTRPLDPHRAGMEEEDSASSANEDPKEPGIHQVILF